MKNPPIEIGGDENHPLLEPIKKLTYSEKRALKSSEIQTIAHNELSKTCASLIGYVDPKGGKSSSDKGMMMPLNSKLSKAIGDRDLLSTPQKMILAAMFLALSDYTKTAMTKSDLYPVIKLNFWKITDAYILAIKAVA